MEKLTDQEIGAALQTVPDWGQDGSGIVREFEFQNFVEAMSFINKVADLAEAHNHHPELFNVYNRVRLRFSTHDAGGLTKNDFSIAREIDNIS